MNTCEIQIVNDLYYHLTKIQTIQKKAQKCKYKFDTNWKAKYLCGMWRTADIQWYSVKNNNDFSRPSRFSAYLAEVLKDTAILFVKKNCCTQPAAQVCWWQRHILFDYGRVFIKNIEYNTQILYSILYEEHLESMCDLAHAHPHTSNFFQSQT